MSLQPLNIQVGQRWKTRGGGVVRITADRAATHEGWPAVDTWRWCLDTGEIASIYGRIEYHGRDNPGDLIELQGETK